MSEKTEAAKATVSQIRALMARHHLTQEQAADVLGVPKPTLLKWLNATREPNASAIRLVQVLSVVEVLAPSIHAGLLTPKKREAATDEGDQE